MKDNDKKIKDAVVLRTERDDTADNPGWLKRTWSTQGGKLGLVTGVACLVLAGALGATIAFTKPAPKPEPEKVAAKKMEVQIFEREPVQDATSPAAQDANKYESDANADEENIDVDLENTEDPDVIVTIDIPFEGEIKYGDRDEVIITVQERLMQLSYMDSDDATDYLGPITKEALIMFQRTSGLDATGNLDAVTYTALMSEGAPEYTVFEGVDGDDVYELQSRLYELGYLKSKPTGYFGSDTKDAVELFQKNNSIEVTGKIDIETRELLYSGDVVAMIWSSGDANTNITPYQERLYELGYLTNEPDGIFGDATIAAVKRFQDRNGLITDGQLGPQTMSVLMSEDAIPNSLALGMKGDDVLAVQERLHKLGYLTSDMETGYFGSVTDHAVRAFQKQNGLSSDGRVGKQTMNILMSDDAKSAPAGYNQYSNSSSSNSGSSSGSSSSSSSSGSSTPVPPASDQPSISNMIEIAKSRLGCRYRTAGKGPDKFDCSGFVYWVMKQSGFSQSYLTSYGWRSVSKYPKIKKISDLQAGDVIVFYGHVGLVVGNDTMIHASSSKGKVCYGSITSSWAKRNFICGYRIFG